VAEGGSGLAGIGALYVCLWDGWGPDKHFMFCVRVCMCMCVCVCVWGGGEEGGTVDAGQHHMCVAML